MTAIDYVVLIGTLLSIAAYGIWKTRDSRNLTAYLRGDNTLRWGTIGLSVMATQASAITFLSMPGLAYESGIGFVQNYFGLPLALILVASVFLPIYRRLNVFTAYEYLGRRFDSKTRLLGAGLFLLQRGLAAGITIYAPAIIVSTVLGWRFDLTIILTGLVAIVYTVSGGNRAVSITQKWQMAVIFAGMVAAFVVLMQRMPEGVGITEAATVAGGLGKLEAVDFSLNIDKRYTFWSGLLGGLFLSLSYFGTDQSQVQRYILGASLREGRLGLMFNAVLKIPMQFFILLLGAFVFVFYQFERPPVFFNQAAWNAQALNGAAEPLQAIEEAFAEVHAQKRLHIEAWLQAEAAGDPVAVDAARAGARLANERSEALRAETRRVMSEHDVRAKTNDADYIFITFVLNHLPRGIVGLIVALIFAAAMSSLASELAALGTTTTVDLFRHVFRRDGADAYYLKASQGFTMLWGVIAILFALFANLVENLVEAINILGSIFYGVVLGIFLVAFFLRRIGGSAVFLAAIAAQSLVIVLFLTLTISYLWYNLIGCAACVLFSFLLQGALGERGAPPREATA